MKFKAWDEKGETVFCKKIRKEHFTQTNISPYARIFVLHVNEGTNNIADLKDIVLNISKKWSNANKTSSRTKDKDRYAPYIYLPGLAENKLIDFKNNLYNEGFLFVDGYPHKGSRFSFSAISEKPNQQRLINFRIFHDIEEVETLINDLTNKTKELYEFYFDKELINLRHNFKHVKIPINSLSMIQNMI